MMKLMMMKSIFWLKSAGTQDFGMSVVCVWGGLTHLGCERG